MRRRPSRMSKSVLNSSLHQSLHTQILQGYMESPKVDLPCWKKRNEGSFLDDLKNHFDEFINTSMEQHKICLKRSYMEFRDYVKLKRQELALKSSNVGNGGDSDGKGTEGSNPVQVNSSQ
ncbi:hypothetical protein J5N97_000604 [Dioscorea zingiberensis]|uniref:Uncharacterized protein n=1 Tax=Dioscorea zingiberensis TaxID=325984 RepID=A0A9D5BV07_9LILI|nr:hypothetical protein J5N97_000604 [Dioscorea zingiberensis]